MKNIIESVSEDAKIAEARKRTAIIYLNKGVEEEAIKKEIEAVIGLNENGVPIPIIAKSLNISVQRVAEILSDR